jgi:hypothetical protein
MARSTARANVHEVDTIPPPPSGDAYAAATVVRLAPPEVLASLRAKKEAREPRQVQGARVTTFDDSLESSPGSSALRWAAIGVLIASVTTFSGALAWLVMK